MERTILTSDDIIKIIQGCAANNVARFKYESLEIDFGTKPIDHQNSPLPNTPIAEHEVSALNNIDRDTFIQDEIELREQQVSELLLENPAELERLHSLGELDVTIKDQSE